MHESPEYLRLSLAAAMTLGFKQGLFYRQAKLTCINLLLTYQEGCFGRCAYCGLSRPREGEFAEKSFIRVEWPTYSLTEIVERMKERENSLERVCLSLITNPRAKKDTVEITQILKSKLTLPISLLITPTLLKSEDLEEFHQAGAERLGVAIDAATERLFAIHRPTHTWGKYWEIFEAGISIFGEGMVGSHLIVGLGESEKEMVTTIQRVRDLGGRTHLFSFYPEKGSELETQSPPPVEQYRRIQLARYLIDSGLSYLSEFIFDQSDQILDFGISQTKLEEIIDTGIPFMTSGCPNKKGEVACTRPYGDSPPGEEIRSFPFYLEKEDIVLVKNQLKQY
ncbi:MAG: radical SAM protein [Candidatus Edwardsbacteria bacterium]